MTTNTSKYTTKYFLKKHSFIALRILEVSRIYLAILGVRCFNIYFILNFFINCLPIIFLSILKQVFCDSQKYNIPESYILFLVVKIIYIYIYIYIYIQTHIYGKQHGVLIYSHALHKDIYLFTYLNFYLFI
jgi:hypothetical protein